MKDGKAVSVTTDGFITDIKDLEDSLKDNLLMSEYRKIREDLSGEVEGLEVKREGKGLISWTTRGQLSKEANIKATTGFQARNLTLADMESMFLDVLSKEDKSIEYIQFSLRSAKDIFKKGGHVTPVYKDQVFRLHYDNRRVIQTDKKLKGKPYDLSKTLLDSLPVESKEVCANLRKVSKLHKTKIYNRETSKLSGNIYKSYIDLAIRNFVKGLVSEPKMYSLDDRLKNYADIIDFVEGYKKEKEEREKGIEKEMEKVEGYKNVKVIKKEKEMGYKRLTKQSISNLKNRNMIFKTVPKTPETLAFVEYVKKTFEHFDVDKFFMSDRKGKQS